MEMSTMVVCHLVDVLYHVKRIKEFSHMHWIRVCRSLPVDVEVAK